MDFCPRCREAIRPGASWTKLAQAQGRRPVWRVAHRRASGASCVAYVGERARAAAPAEAGRPDFRAPLIDLAAALARRAG